MKSQDILDKLRPLLGHLGEVVLAGGGIRDELMAREPKDYDAFILLGKPFSFEYVREEVWEALEAVDEDRSGSTPFKAAEVIFEGTTVQIMLTPYKTVEELLASFDWNVCLFASDGVKTWALEEVANIGKGMELKLHKITYPLSTLRRGYRFSERFGMVLRQEDMIQLCTEVLGVLMSQGEQDETEIEERVSVI